ncbi:MAG: phosphate uptake regulator PhoU [Nitrososphaerota archaeon]|nr:phosphate uptake regulator PhoU [Nitrososphaerota archaeon]
MAIAKSGTDLTRKIQKVGYSTLTVSIPKSFVKELGLKAGGSLLFRQDSDGTLRLMPITSAKKSSRVIVKADQAGSEEMLARLVISSYAVGYDTIEISSRTPLPKVVVDRVTEIIRRLRGLEVVESDSRRIVAQSFLDPTKFPVDSLIKRLQMLVSSSLENVVEALDLKRTSGLNDVKRIQDEIDELYWLIVRQLLVALNRRELAAEIGIESPLHASGDRVIAKTLDEIGGIILDIAEELVRLKSKGTTMEPEVVEKIRVLAAKAGEAFNLTVESILTPEIRLLERSATRVEETLRMEKEITHEMLESGGHGYARVIVSHFAQLARYCNIVIEIASHRLLRKSSRLATVQ